MPENLAELVSSLSPEDQTAVREFIVFLKERQEPGKASAFLDAIDDFIAEHPELLRRLAQ